MAFSFLPFTSTIPEGRKGVMAIPSLPINCFEFFIPTVYPNSFSCLVKRINFLQVRVAGIYQINKKNPTIVKPRAIKIE